MNKRIIKTEFEDMYEVDINIYKCPVCGDSEIFKSNKGKWFARNFTRLTCEKCNSYIVIAGKNFTDGEV